MGKRPFILLIIILSLAACDPGQGGRRSDGPQLIQDITLAPTTPAPTRVLSPTPSPIKIAVSTSTLNSELISPLDVATLDAGFVLVTPTLATPPVRIGTYTGRATLAKVGRFVPFTPAWNVPR